MPKNWRTLVLSECAASLLVKGYMKILVIEDDAERIAFFRTYYRDHDLHVVSDVNLAVQWLSEEEYDRIFLDHDLDLSQPPRWIPQCNRIGVGRDVAHWLIARPECNKHARIIIHSMNVIAAPKIFAELTKAGRLCVRLPFSVLRDAAIPLERSLASTQGESISTGD